MLRAVKPRTIGRVNRAELARTRTIWCSLMQEERVARDIAHGIDLANAGAHIATSEGAAASFSGTQAASAILPSLRGLVEADWPKIAVVARIRATGAQPGNPGNAFGVCGSALQLGVGVGFDGANVGGTILHNSGAGVAVGMPATQGRWYTVLAQGAPGANGLIRAWVDGGRVGSPDATAGFGAGPPDEVVLGGMHRASGFLRQFRGDVLWGAVLLGDGDHWVTDEFAADLFASGYPYNMARATSRSIWLPASGEPPAPGPVTPPLLTNSQGFYVPSVGRGPVALSAPLLASAGQAFAPSVGRGPVAVSPPLLANAQTLFSPVATSVGAALRPPLLANTSTAYAPEVGRGAVTLAGPLLFNSAQVFAPVVGSGTVSIGVPLLANALGVHAPSVQAGAVAMSAPLLVAAGAMYAPSVSAGAVQLMPPVLASTQIFYPASVSEGRQPGPVAVGQLVGLPRLGRSVVAEKLIRRVSL